MHWLLSAPNDPVPAHDGAAEAWRFVHSLLVGDARCGATSLIVPNAKGVLRSLALLCERGALREGFPGGADIWPALERWVVRTARPHPCTQPPGHLHLCHRPHANVRLSL